MSTQTDAYVPTAQDLTSIAELVWASYVDGEIVPDPAGSDQGYPAVIAHVSIAGPWNGAVLIGCDPAASRGIAAAMFAMEPEEVSDEEVGDAFGEMANIIGGNVKALMPEPSVLSLPSVALDTRGLQLPGAVMKSRADLLWNGAPVHISVWEGQSAHGGN